MAKKTTAVAKATKKEVADMSAFDDFANAGMENVTSDDMLVPRLGIIQTLSPQLKKRDSQYIEDAEEGMICEIGTGELFPDGCLFLPVMYDKVWIEWAPRASGKGIVNIHSDPSILDLTTPDDKGKPHLENGNYIAETAQFFGINLTNRQLCFIPMPSTQLKKARKLITMARGEKVTRADGSEYTPPLFYRAYELGSAEEGNAEGDWHGWTITRGDRLMDLDIGVPWETIFQQATAFLEDLKRGAARADKSAYEEGEAKGGGRTKASGDDGGRM